MVEFFVTLILIVITFFLTVQNAVVMEQKSQENGFLIQTRDQRLLIILKTFWPSLVAINATLVSVAVL